MEEKKKHIEIIIDMNKEKGTTEVQLTARKLSPDELIKGYVAAAHNIAAALADKHAIRKQDVYYAIALGVLELGAGLGEVVEK